MTKTLYKLPLHISPILRDKYHSPLSLLVEKEDLPLLSLPLFKWVAFFPRTSSQRWSGDPSHLRVISTIESRSRIISIFPHRLILLTRGLSLEEAVASLKNGELERKQKLLSSKRHRPLSGNWFDLSEENWNWSKLLSQNLFEELKITLPEPSVEQLIDETLAESTKVPESTTSSHPSLDDIFGDGFDGSISKGESNEPK